MEEIENIEEIKKDNFLVIDGNSIMNRAFYGVKLLSTKDGLYTNAIYGFLNIYFMIKEKLQPKYVSVAFDLSAPTFRHKLYSEYKAGRHAMPTELRAQMPLIKEVLNALNIPILEKEGFEADDILGTISISCTNKGIPTYILTGDRDSFQLISDMTTVILPTAKPGKTEYTYYTPELLFEKYNIKPCQVPDVKALMGDASDNIKGVPGIGEKTAYPLISKYGSIEKIYEDVRSIDATPSVISKLEINEDSARQSKILATINTNVELGIDFDSFRVEAPNLAELVKLFTRFEFKKFIEKFSNGVEENNLVTDKSKDYYSLMDNISFILIDSKDKLDDLNNIKDSLSLMILDSKQDILNGMLIAFTNNTIYIIAKGMYEYALPILCTLDVKKTTYNLKKIEKCAFDIGINKFVGFKSDVMIEYYLLHVSENNYSIENIIYNLLDVPSPVIEVSKTNVQTSLFDEIDNSVTKDSVLSEQNKKVIYYNIAGLENIHTLLQQELKEKQLFRLYSDIELPLVEVLANIEHNGMYVDKNRLEDFGKSITIRIDEIVKKIYDISGSEFNVNSTQQLGHILFEKLHIPYPKKTKGNNYSTDKETLESIEGDFEIIDLVLEYRMLAKLRSTYVEGLLQVIKDDGRIHTTFMQTATVTGRLSSIEPNLQNIPIRTELGGKIRDCFVSENSSIIIDADYSQIELRVLAHMSQDMELIKGFNEDLDIHSITASQVFGIPQDMVTKDLRSKAKAVNFGIVYGISEYGLAKNINSTRPEAARYIRNYLNHYIGVDKYMKNVIEQAKKEGIVQTIFGRKREVPELKSANYLTRNFGERIAMNMPIQGTAADIMKIAMIKTYKELKQRKLSSRIIMQVHDELLIEAPESEVDIVKEILKSSMENAMKLDVPLKVDVNVGSTWLNAK